MEIQSQIKSMIEYCAYNNYDVALMLFIDDEKCTTHIIDSSPLRVAIKNNSVDVVRVLLSHGSNASTDDSQLLCQTVADGKNEIAELLIEFGANVIVDNNDPLRLAFSTRNYHMADVLIKKGANVKDKRLMDSVRRLNDFKLFNILVGEDSAALSCEMRTATASSNGK